MSLSDIDSLKKIVENIKDVPILPHVVTEIMKAVYDPSTSAQDLSNIISKDAALTAKLLKVANSAYFGFQRRISSIPQAVVLLGFNEVRGMAISFSVFDIFEESASGEFDRIAFWEHSYSTAICTEICARYVGHAQSSSFVAGLLHDFGKIILDFYFHDQFDTAVKRARDENTKLYITERKTFGLTHCHIGKWLGIKWGLPEDLIECIRFHHEPDYASEHSKLVYLVHLANILVRKNGMGSGGDSVNQKIAANLYKVAQLNEQDIENIEEELLKKQEDTKQMVMMFTEK
jgi:HD-like signal output (HDOD) protein